MAAIPHKDDAHKMPEAVTLTTTKTAFPATLPPVEIPAQAQ